MERSVKVQEGLLSATNQIKDNMKELNDKFALHCQELGATNGDIRAIKQELLKYLKWAILALLILLGGQKVVELFLTYAK